MRIASLNAWKQCKDARPNSAGIRLDWDVLESVANYQTSGSIKAQLTIGGVDRYLKMLPGTDGYSGQCNTCTPGSQPVCERLPMMHVYLNSLKDFAVKYGSKTDFNKFITGEATASGLNKQDGAYHLMRDLNNRSYTAGTVVSFEGSISSKMQGFAGTILCNGCSYDVEKAGNVLVDYKSYDCRTGIKEDQFKQYLQYWSSGGIGNNGNVIPPRDFEYVFNSEKITLEEAKKKFVTLLKSDPAGYYNVNPTFFNRISGVLTAEDFTNEVSKTNFWQNNIFDFVTIVP